MIRTREYKEVQEMKVPTWLIELLSIKPRKKKLQAYRDDTRYKYNLIYISKTGTRFGLAYSTSVPLSEGNNILLAPGKVLTVIGITHVIYSPQDNAHLTRPTTFVHVGVVPSVGSAVTEGDFNYLGFTPIDKILPYTIH